MKKILIPICLLIPIISILSYNHEEKLELINLINYEIEEKELYTPNSYNEYEKALNEAISIKTEIFSSKNELNSAYKYLKNTIDNLILKPDKKELRNKYQSVINYNKDLYIPASTTNLNLSIKNAENILNDENSTIKDVNNAINQINNSIEELILKPDKTVLENIINNTKNIDKDKYTTESYNQIENSLSKASLILHNENSTQEDIDNIINVLNNDINHLVIASRGIYKINIYTYMLSNNHVGNEWYYYTTYNNNEFYSGNQIIGKNNSTIDLTTTIIECDKITDSGTSYTTIKLENGFETTKQITVRENRGRYTGNTAIWEVKYIVNLIETIN